MRKKMHKNSKFNFKELDSFAVLKVDPKYKVLKTFSQSYYTYIFFSGNGIIKSNKVARVMKTVDRGDFTQKSGHAYQDSPQLIGYGVTISAPHMVRKKRKYQFQN